MVCGSTGHGLPSLQRCRCVQADWAVLPTLHHTITLTQRRLQKLPDVVENFITTVNLSSGVCKGVEVEGTEENLKELATWSRLLIARTTAKLASRYDITEGKLLWGASLFDRRTWPHGDMSFNDEVVARKLAALKNHFPWQRCLTWTQRHLLGWHANWLCGYLFCDVRSCTRQRCYPCMEICC